VAAPGGVEFGQEVVELLDGVVKVGFGEDEDAIFFFVFGDGR